MGLVFGKYEKIKPLAQGGMGEVFLARQVGVLDRLVILKALRPDLAREQDFIDQFLDEARVAATLNHPNIVAIFDVGASEGVYYIAMEYIPGDDLSRLWYAAAKAGIGLPFQVSVKVIQEAALGLDHAHRATDLRGKALQIVHRDVSPQNLMVRIDGVTKLVDFGIAKATNKESRTQAGMVKGKLQYMSPEQVRGEPLDGRSDQFSLGIVLWEMCTGRRLFKADTEMNTLQKILNHPIPKPSQHVPGFPAELEAVIMKMLERDREARFTTLSDVATKLKDYLDRAAMAGGEMSVGAFVQKILGKDVEERTRDLTPMEPPPEEEDNDRTVVAGPPPPPPSRPNVDKPAAKLEGRTRTSQGPGVGTPPAQPTRRAEASADLSSSSAAHKAAPRPPGKTPSKPRAKAAPDTEFTGAPLSTDVGTGATREDSLSGLPVGATGDWSVRRVDGSVTHFDKLAVLQQWISEGKLVVDDVISSDGRNWQRLGDDASLAQFFEVAAQARTLPPDDVAQREHGTSPAGAAAGAQDDAMIAAANDPFASTEAASTMGFSLGQLPSGQATGTWGAPELARAAAAVQAEAGLGEGPGTNVRASTSRRVPSVAWVIAGVCGAVVLVGLALRVVAPDMLGALVGAEASAAGPAMSEALALVRGDDESALRERAATIGFGDDDAIAVASDVDMLTAASLLQTELARQQATRVALVRATKGAASSTDAGLSSLRDRALKLASRAAEIAPKRREAHLALAAAHGERGAGAEMREALGRVAADSSVVATEAGAIAALAAGTAALGADDATRAAAIGTLSSWSATHADDKRFNAMIATLLALRAAADPTRIDAAAGTVTSWTTAAPRDGRATLAKTLVDNARAQEARTATAGNPASTTSGPPGGSNAADKSDAGVVAAATTTTTTTSDAGPPPPPETYEVVLEKAKKARTADRSSEAVRLYKKALELKPGDVAAQLGLAWSTLDVGRGESAAKGFRVVLGRDGSNAEAQFGLAEALRQQGLTTDATQAYERYLEIAPSGPDADAARNAIRALQ